jgi:hypothetical protein
MSRLHRPCREAPRLARISRISKERRTFLSNSVANSLGVCKNGLTRAHLWRAASRGKPPRGGRTAYGAPMYGEVAGLQKREAVQQSAPLLGEGADGASYYYHS